MLEQDSSLTKPAQADPVEAKNIVSDPIASSLVPRIAEPILEVGIVTADVSGNQKTLEAKIAALRLQIDDTRAKLQHDAAKLKHPDASQTMQNHIRLLREYNDIRDIGTSLMGIIADNRRVQMKRVYEEFDLDQKD
ncbi:MAG: hypothetical protein Q9188_000040 [Gyalolechia gomerana]